MNFYYLLAIEIIGALICASCIAFFDPDFVEKDPGGTFWFSIFWFAILPICVVVAFFIWLIGKGRDRQAKQATKLRIAQEQQAEVDRVMKEMEEIQDSFKHKNNA